MADHIVVFDGTPRLIGHTVRVAVTDASPFTLYGDVLTDEVIGVDATTPERERRSPEPPPARPDRFSLPLV